MDKILKVFIKVFVITTLLVEAQTSFAATPNYFSISGSLANEEIGWFYSDEIYFGAMNTWENFVSINNNIYDVIDYSGWPSPIVKVNSPPYTIGTISKNDYTINS